MFKSFWSCLAESDKRIPFKPESEKNRLKSRRALLSLENRPKTVSHLAGKLYDLPQITGFRT